MLHGQEHGVDSAEALNLDSAAEQLEGLLDDDGMIGAEEQKPASRKPKTASESDEPEDDSAAGDDEEPEAPSDDDEENEPVDDEEHEESDDEDDSEEPAEQPKHKVKVNGQELEVTLEEALKGYSREQDYTRKSQKHAETVKAFEAEANAVRAERQQYLSAITEVESQLKALGTEPDWDKLAAEHPEQLAQIHAAWTIHKGKLDRLTAEKAAVETKMKEDADKAFNQHISAESAKLIDALPEWKEPEKYKAGMTELQDYARTLGFSNDELDGVNDHRVVLMLRKAMQYDRSLKAKADVAVKAKAKIDKVKTAQPGTNARPGKKVTERTRRVQRLAKTHSAADAASILELSLAD